MAPKQPSTTTQITEVKLPQWVNDASKANYDLAVELGSKPFEQYQGDRVAGLGSNAMAAIQKAYEGAGSAQAGYDSANSIFSQLAEYANGITPSNITADRTTAGNVTAGKGGYHTNTAQNVAADAVQAGTAGYHNTTSNNVMADLVRAGKLTDVDLSGYMNPYLSEVENNALNSMDRSRMMALNSNASAAQAAGAFGGSRHGIVDAVTNAEVARDMGNLSSTLRKEGFDRATGLAMADIDRALMADVGNADRSLQANVGNADRQLTSDRANADRMTTIDASNLDRALSAAVGNADRSLTAGLANADRQFASSKANADRMTSIDASNLDRELAANVGNADRQLTSDTNNANRNLQADQFNAQNILDTLAARTSALGTAGSGIMEATAGSQQARQQDLQSLLSTGLLQQQQAQALIDADRQKFNEARDYDLENLNLRLSALGMSPYGKSESSTKTSTGGNSGTDFGQLGLGIFSLLLGLSEDDTKTDKEKVGKVPGTNLDLWAYRYKKDPKNYPKVVGVMASDVEKKMPEAVRYVGGKRVVDYGHIMGKIAHG